MATDKSLFYYGSIYHAIMDPLIKPSWRQIATVIPKKSRVFDAGCGTGRLALLLTREKECQVIGADLSRKQLSFAERSTPDDKVKFVHMDVSNTAYPDDSFDYSVMCQVIHEIPSDKQPSVVSELMRIARRTVILDSNTPLPKNYVGLTIRFMDATFGGDHYDKFKSYIASGGILGILERMGITSRIIQRVVFRRNALQMVVLARDAANA